MFAVKGIYAKEAGIIQPVREEIPVKEDYEVIITFVKPAYQQEDDAKVEVSDQVADKERREGYEHFMKYAGTVHRHIDYKEELMEYLDERYDRTY